ncbi:Putative carboxymethylenebutenolidase (Dienelactone hydrolase) (DLH) [Bradyrhizobium sp. ORS 285]|uniref:dienelactone hydrolase family protein n=1 Tax=Bradyrhizobium sp. ORS 285 TaxID=115808 RepID=UPI00024094A5|nr:dienelactone hydrolase family protein [Bradyrhizobium sp. ORS 285]CCD85755.1 putative carboxymethylenebutenolidase (Dienelactone hydrolase) (DLH) [Bradyrhizobium sp. ORS 285]SMX58253.1 Putative carboxymethylenebutenolidase (Dienelactone hydrolase) (DLH) [Bradyrhizobium sp. ORS 285]
MTERLATFRALCIAAIVLVFVPTMPSHAADTVPQELTVSTADASMTIKLFAGQREGPRPAVIILHGAQGLERYAAAYSRYAQALAAKGIDAALVSYYDATDIGPMSSADQKTRQAYFSAHVATWSERVRGAASLLTRREGYSGKIGLLGFSNGGFLAVATAASDPRITALVVFYAGRPDLHDADPFRLPPLLALHGDADRNVPLSSGKALVEAAQAAGREAELVIYHGMGHGFDFDATRPEAADALARATSFFLERLK